MQKPQNFIESFLNDASHFGLHLDTSNTGPFEAIGGKLAVAKVLNLLDTYVFVMNTGHVLVMDGSIDTENPARWTTKAVSTVEELADWIRSRRVVQSGRWN